MKIIIRRVLLIGGAIGFIAVAVWYQSIGTILESIPLIAYEVYRSNAEKKAKIEDAKLREKKQRFSSFRHSLSCLNELLHKIYNLVDTDSVLLLSDELAQGLLRYNSNARAIIELFDPRNCSHLKTIIRAVEKRNNLIEKQDAYYVQINNNLSTILSLFPSYSVLLQTLFDIILFYNQDKTSTTSILAVLTNERTEDEIRNVLCTESSISRVTQFTTIIHRNLNLQPAIDTRSRKVIVTRETLLLVKDMIDLLLFSYCSLDDVTLEEISKKQQKEYMEDKLSHMFIEVCSATLVKIMVDLDSQTNEDIFNLYNKIKESLNKNNNNIRRGVI